MSEFNLDWVREYCPKGLWSVFDVGAYDCGDAMRFKAAYPKASVLAFEANPAAITLAVTRGAPAAGVKIIWGVVKDDNEPTLFYPNDDPRQEGNPGMSGSFLETTAALQEREKHLVFKKPIIVPGIRLMDFCLQNIYYGIDLLHLDVQGAEGHVLRGLGPIRPKMIFLEVDETDNYEGAVSRFDVAKMLDTMGYRRKWIGAHDEFWVYEPHLT
jgi:FkbM family methyltransferase